MYETTYYTTSSNLTGASAAALGGTMIIITLVVSLVCAAGAYIFMSLLYRMIFKKAGVKTSIAWIPIYNSWKFLEIGDQKGFWSIMSFIPGLNIVAAIFMYIAMFHIGKKLGKEDWFVLVGILAAPIWFLILGLDKSVWNGGTNAAPTETPTAPVSDYTAPEPNPVSLNDTTNVESPAMLEPEVASAPAEPVAAAPEPMAPTPTETAETPAAPAEADTASVDSDNTEA